jgi:hypothetical protein
MPVHHSGKCRQIAIPARFWVSLQKLKHSEDARVGPPFNGSLHRAQFGVAESHFLPRPNHAVMFTIGAKHAGKKFSQASPHVVPASRGLQVKTRQPLQQLVHQHNQQLPF